MKRREFITLLGGAAATWPLAVRAQDDRRRRIGILMPYPAGDTEALARIGAFREALAATGWSEDRNLQVEYRWVRQENQELLEAAARQLIGLRPDVILTSSNSTTTLLSTLTKTIPIVFGSASVATETGLIGNMAHPGGNVTGFTQIESSITGKYLDLLKEVQPRMTAVLMVQGRLILQRSPAVQTMMALAARFGVGAIPAPSEDASELENSFAEFAARAEAKGVVVLSSPVNIVRRSQIIALVRRHSLPAVYPYRVYPAEGGLMSYGPDLLDQFRKAAGYVDRILRGEKAGDLPVQAPTKYELVINLKTARALGLTVPTALLVRADEVIE